MRRAPGRLNARPSPSRGACARWRAQRARVRQDDRVFKARRPLRRHRRDSASCPPQGHILTARPPCARSRRRRDTLRFQFASAGARRHPPAIHARSIANDWQCFAVGIGTRLVASRLPAPGPESATAGRDSTRRTCQLGSFAAGSFRLFKHIKHPNEPLLSY